MKNTSASHIEKQAIKQELRKSARGEERDRESTAAAMMSPSPSPSLSPSSSSSSSRPLPLVVSGALIVPTVRFAVRSLRSLWKRYMGEAEEASPAPEEAAAGGDGVGSFDAATFERWVSMRLGGHGQTKFWFSSGELHSYPDGELLAIVEGFDVLHCIRESREGGTVHQLSRKLFVFRDARTGAVLERFGGAPVQAVRYPYQKISYSLTPDGLLFTEVTQGSGESLTTMSGTSIEARRLGGRPGGAVFSCPVFINMETESGATYECYENYDFFVPTSVGAATANALPPHCSWVRYGAAPPFSSTAVMHIVSWRVDTFAELPERMRKYTMRHAPGWCTPPTSLDEVERMMMHDESGDDGVVPQFTSRPEEDEEDEADEDAAKDATSAAL